MPDQSILCRYHYDPLDRLAARMPLAEAMARQFYKAGQYVTELEGSDQRTLLCAESEPLALKSSSSSALLAIDSSNSVLHVDNTAIVYSPYGHRELPVGLPGLPGFNGEQPDPVTGHYLLGNGYRSYNPVLMRFNSPDNLSPFGKGGLNAYAYCAGDPVNRSDPTGHIFYAKAFLGLLTKTSRRALKAVGKGPKKMLKPEKIITQPDFGDLNVFSGTPHVLDNIVSHLKGDDLVSFSLASRATRDLVCCSRNRFSLFSATLQMSFQPWRAYRERSGHHA